MTTLEEIRTSNLFEEQDMDQDCLRQKTGYRGWSVLRATGPTSMGGRAEKTYFSKQFLIEQQIFDQKICSKSFDFFTHEEK